MSGKRVWFCPTCGYEVNSRGRCFRCRDRLVASPLPELEQLDEDDEVAYRLDEWDDAGRGRLIVTLIRANVPHRFDDEELVVAADDESKVDDLLAELVDVLAAERADEEPDDEEGEAEGAWVPIGAGTEADEDDAGSGSRGDAGAGEAGEEPAGAAAPEEPPYVPDEVMDEETEAVRESIVLLYGAALRLEEDPTDMQADSDVAEASAGIFSVEGFPGLREEAWAAVGRTTRRLLAALGADEALEDEIRKQAAALVRLLAPVADRSAMGVDGTPGQIVYELPDWTADHRQELVAALDAEGIAYGWDAEDLVVAADREDEVDAILGTFSPDGEGDDGEDDDGEARYRAFEELFAAADRLAKDPGNESKRSEAAAAVVAADGGTPFGMADIEWWQLRARARALADAIAQGAGSSRVHDDAEAVRDLLRAIV